MSVLQIEKWKAPQPDGNKMKSDLQNLMFRILSLGYVDMAIIDMSVSRVVIWKNGKFSAISKAGSSLMTSGENTPWAHNEQMTKEIEDQEIVSI